MSLEQCQFPIQGLVDLFCHSDLHLLLVTEVLRSHRWQELVEFVVAVGFNLLEEVVHLESLPVTGYFSCVMLIYQGLLVLLVRMLLG